MTADHCQCHGNDMRESQSSCEHIYVDYNAHSQQP